MRKETPWYIKPNSFLYSRRSWTGIARCWVLVKRVSQMMLSSKPLRWPFLVSLKPWNSKLLTVSSFTTSFWTYKGKEWSPRSSMKITSLCRIPALAESNRHWPQAEPGNIVLKAERRHRRRKLQIDLKMWLEWTPIKLKCFRYMKCNRVSWKHANWRRSREISTRSFIIWTAKECWIF